MVSELVCVETEVVPYVEPSVYDRSKVGAAGPGGKFDEARRKWYLELRRAGRAHLTALRTVDISSSTYERYSAAVGEPWKAQVRAAREESLDPIRDRRRKAALDGEPWAIDREIGKGRDRGGEEDPQIGVRQGAGVNVNVLGVAGPGGAVGISVEGGAAGVDSALDTVLARLRERKAVTSQGAG